MSGNVYSRKFVVDVVKVLNGKHLTENVENDADDGIYK